MNRVWRTLNLKYNNTPSLSFFSNFSPHTKLKSHILTSYKTMAFFGKKKKPLNEEVERGISPSFLNFSLSFSFSSPFSLNKIHFELFSWGWVTGSKYPPVRPYSFMSIPPQNIGMPQPTPGHLISIRWRINDKSMIFPVACELEK